MNINISIETKESLPSDYEEILNKVCLEVAEYHSLGEEYEGAEVSLVFCDGDYIQELNRQYRNVDRVTDVLSFPMDDAESAISTEEFILGDIVICVLRMKEQAKEYGHSETRELAFLFLHGMLHLLGYDHIEDDDREEMEQVQREILESLGINR